VGDARFFPYVGNNVQRARAAWRDGGGGVGPTRTGCSHGWSMVPCRQRPSWTETEANLFREVLHWSWGGARFFQCANNNVQHVCDGWHVGGGGVCVKGIGSKMIVSVQSSKFKVQSSKFKVQKTQQKYGNFVGFVGFAGLPNFAPFAQY
jgi:hypothetical protein